MSDFRFSHIGIAEDSSPLEYNSVIWWVIRYVLKEHCAFIKEAKNICALLPWKVWEITVHLQYHISSDLNLQYYITSFYQMATDDSLVKNRILIHIWGTYIQALAKPYWYIICGAH